MAIYCNVEDCLNWYQMATTIQSIKRPGYVPIGKLGEYKGTCKLNNIQITSNTFTNKTTKKIFPICNSFNKKIDIQSNMNCYEQRCGFYKDGECDKLNSGLDIFVDVDTAFVGENLVKYPRCKTFSNRKHENAVDWSKRANPKR